MKLKRICSEIKLNHIFFALVVVLFALNGCVSASPKMLDEKENMNQKTVLKTSNDFALAQYKDTVVESEVIPVPEKITQYDESGVSWLSYEMPGSQGYRETVYNVVKNRFNQTIKKEVDLSQSKLVEAVAPVHLEGSTVRNDAYFQAKTTAYGVDCYGCNLYNNDYGFTASGIQLSMSKGVKQSSGAFKPGITYDGYYIVAADKSLPIGTILEISNHSYSGAGLTPGVPFYAIVADRGGGVRGPHLDIYVGSQRNPQAMRTGKRSASVKIVSVGNGRRLK